MTPFTTIDRRPHRTSGGAPTMPIVFVVDDDASVRESVDLLIQTEGWKAETFASAQEFMARPRAVGPSCLILDVSLPDRSGLDLQRRVAVERPDMPIIVISADGDVPISVQAMKAGVGAELGISEITGKRTAAR